MIFEVLWELVMTLGVYKQVTMMQSPLSLLQTLIHSLFGSSRDYRNLTSSQCSDCQSPRVITSSHKTSDMHDLFMKCEEFYQDIYNNNINMDTISSFCQRDRFCRWEKHVKLNCLEEIKL